MDNLTLIKLYAETGAILSKYQLSKLSTNLRRTYLRRRLLQAEQTLLYELEPHEVKYLPQDYEEDYLRTAPLLTKQQFIDLPTERLKKIYVTAKVNAIVKKRDFSIMNASAALIKGKKHEELFNIEKPYLDAEQLEQYEEFIKNG